MTDVLPFFASVAGVALTAICCAICSCCSTRRLRQNSEALHQRILVLEQAPAKVIVHGPSPPVYYQSSPVTVVASPPSQPKPSAPPSYPSYYPPYSSAYQGQQHPVVR